MGTTVTDATGRFNFLDTQLDEFNQKKARDAAAAAAQAKVDEQNRLAGGAVLNPYASAALQGFTFGAGDELTAGARTVLGSIQDRITPPESRPTRPTYSEALAQERAQNAKFAAEHPWQNVGAQVAGALPHMLLSRGRTAPGVAADLAPTFLSTARLAAVRGGAEGAAQGFGEGEGGVIPRVVNAAQGALLGGVTGGAGEGLVQGGTALVKGLYSKLAPAWSPRAATRVAEQKLAQNLQREGGLPLTQGRLSDYSAQNAENIASGLPDPRLTFGEITGGQVQDSMNAAVRLPGQGAAEVARDAAERRTGRLDRVRGAMQSVFGDLDGQYTARTRLYDERRATASPLYDQAFAGARPLTAGDIEYLQRVPAGAAAYAQQLAQADGRRLSFVPRYDEHGRMILDPTPGGATMPTPEDMHHLKTGMDMFLQANSPNGVPNALAGRFAAVRDTIRDRLDTLTTDANGQSLYRTAREAWAGPTARIDALDIGRRAMGMDGDELAHRLAGMTEAERIFAVQGYMSSLNKTLDRVHLGAGESAGNTNPVRHVFDTPEQRRTAETMLGALGLTPEQVSARMRQMSAYFDAETRGHGGETLLLKGSPTEKLRSWKEDLTQTAIPMGVGGAGGFAYSPTAAALAAATVGTGAIGRQVAARGTENLSTNMLRLTGATDPAAHQATMRAIAERARRVAAGPSQGVATDIGVAGGVVGPQLPNIVSPDDPSLRR